MKFKLFDSVIALRDLTESELMGAWGAGKPGLVNGRPGVVRGTRGAVVEIFEKLGGVAVEFFDADGETIDVAFIRASYVRKAPETRKAMPKQARRKAKA